MQPIERGLFRRRSVGIDTGGRAADLDFDRMGPGDHRLERDPPQPAGPFGEIAGDVDGKRCVEFTQHRQREIPVVAIAVVERETGEPPRKVAFDQPPMHLVHGNDVDALRPKVRQRGAQKLGRDLEVPVGLELAATAWPHMMQHENGADTGEDRPQQIMGAGEVQRFQSGADDAVAKLLHRKWLAQGCDGES